MNQRDAQRTCRPCPGRRASASTDAGSEKSLVAPVPAFIGAWSEHANLESLPDASTLFPEPDREEPEHRGRQAAWFFARVRGRRDQRRWLSGGEAVHVPYERRGIHNC